MQTARHSVTQTHMMSLLGIIKTPRQNHIWMDATLKSIGPGVVPCIFCCCLFLNYERMHSQIFVVREIPGTLLVSSCHKNIVSSSIFTSITLSVGVVIDMKIWSLFFLQPICAHSVDIISSIKGYDWKYDVHFEEHSIKKFNELRCPCLDHPNLAPFFDPLLPAWSLEIQQSRKLQILRVQLLKSNDVVS